MQILELCIVHSSDLQSLPDDRPVQCSDLLGTPTSLVQLRLVAAEGQRRRVEDCRGLAEHKVELLRGVEVRPTHAHHRLRTQPEITLNHGSYHRNCNFYPKNGTFFEFNGSLTTLWHLKSSSEMWLNNSSHLIRGARNGCDNPCGGWK